jgi:hypothetical protein
MKTSFKSFIAEAQFSESDFKRLLNILERRMPKLLGGHIYRCGGHDGVQKLSNSQQGYLYFFGSGKAFQVRCRAGKVLGIDIWKKYTTDVGPSFTADLHELDVTTIIGAMGKLARIIRSPSAGEVNLAEALAAPEGIELMEMAKRVDAQAFYKLMKAAYGDGAKNVTWEQIKKVADESDVLIPVYIRNQKIGRGRWNAEPDSVDVVDSAEASPEDKGPEEDAPQDAAPKTSSSREIKKIEPKAPDVKTGKADSILYIKVTAQDPNTKRFVSSATDPAAQKLFKQLQGSLNGPPADAELKDPDTLYGHLAQLVSLACKGNLRSLLIYGGPGTGKTYTIMKTINEMGMTKGKDYVKLSGKATAVEIYKVLFMFRKGGLVLFDDLDSMWGNPDATNVLKAALDTSPVREISWSSNATQNVSSMSDEDREAYNDGIDDEIANGNEKIKYPSTFDFKGRVVFISNLRKEQFDSAILSRSAKINMDLTAAQILQRMRKILPSLGGDDVTIDQKEELLDHLLVMHGRKEIDQVTMREFTKGLDIVRSGVQNWRELVQYS